ncbi:MAG TPA: hypothetical protein VFP50_14280, partial [Anaeromyxobacteraceae bacterium]|nr:hypothetical protein [Anaeromyxobacteraceae bacterium]
MVRPSLALARSLLLRPAALAAALALAALGLAGGLVPLLDVPGYELGLLGGLAGLALAGIPGPIRAEDAAAVAPSRPAPAARPRSPLMKTTLSN